MKINHLNIPDENDEVYCHKAGEVVKFDTPQMEMCATCPLFGGTIQGNGIECYWNDNRKGLKQPYFVSEPHAERDSVKRAERRGDA